MPSAPLTRHTLSTAPLSASNCRTTPASGSRPELCHRCGSRMSASSGSRTRPGTPTSTNNCRHGSNSPISGIGVSSPAALQASTTPPTNSAVPVPNVAPSEKMPSAMPRRRGVKQSMMSDDAAGISAASPRPTATLPAKKLQKSPASPHAIVATDHSVIPAMITFRRLARSASRPHGTAANAKITANPAPCSRLISKSVSMSSARIGSTTRLMTNRSVKDTKSARQRIVTEYQPAAAEASAALPDLSSSIVVFATAPFPICSFVQKAIAGKWIARSRKTIAAASVMFGPWPP